MLVEPHLVVVVSSSVRQNLGKVLKKELLPSFSRLEAGRALRPVHTSCRYNQVSRGSLELASENKGRVRHHDLLFLKLHKLGQMIAHEMRLKAPDEVLPEKHNVEAVFGGLIHNDCDGAATLNSWHEAASLSINVARKLARKKSSSWKHSFSQCSSQT